MAINITKKLQICKLKKLFKKKYKDSDFFTDAIRSTVLETNNDFFFYMKKGIQGMALASLAAIVYNANTFKTVSPLIVKRVLTQ